MSLFHTPIRKKWNFFSNFSAFSPLWKNILLGFFLFVLAFSIRFWNIEKPQQVVFDEFHFFHFVADYEKGEYFFDIHPPLGKLILWGNAKLFGIEEYAEHAEEEKNFRESFLETTKKLEQEIKTTEDAQKKFQLEQEYAAIQNKYLAIQQKPFEKYEIGTPYPEHLNIAGIRALPAFFGALLIPLLFAFVLLFSQNRWIASTIAVIVAFAPEMVTESRFVLMDSFLVFCVFSSAFFFVLHEKNNRWWSFFLAIFFTACAVSTKWTGFSAIGFGILVLLWQAFFSSFLDFSGFSGKNQNIFLAETLQDRKEDLKGFKNLSGLLRILKNLTFKIFVMFAVVFAVYTATFAVHFGVLHKSGSGDAYHSPEFLATLENTKESENTEIVPKNFWQKFLELNQQMGDRNAAITAEHPFASSPFDWFFGQKPIFYWQEKNTPATEEWSSFAWANTIFTPYEDERKSHAKEIYLFTNPFFWTIGSLSVLVLLCLFAFQKMHAIMEMIQKKSWKVPEKFLNEWKYSAFFLAGYIGNMLPFLMVSRSKFLYHAFSAHLFSLLVFAVLLHKISQTEKKSSFWTKSVCVGMCGFAVFFFLKYSALVYGSPFLETQRLWLFFWQ